MKNPKSPETPKTLGKHSWCLASLHRVQRPFGGFAAGQREDRQEKRRKALLIG